MYSSPFVLVLMLINVAFSAVSKSKYIELEDEIPLISLGSKKMNKKPQELKDDDIPPNSLCNEKMNKKPQKLDKTSTQTIEVLGDEKMDIKIPQEPNKTPIQIIQALGSSTFNPKKDNLNVINQEALAACNLVQKEGRYYDIEDWRKSVMTILEKNYMNYNTNVNLTVLEKLLMVLMGPELSSSTIRHLITYVPDFIIFFFNVYSYDPEDDRYYKLDYFPHKKRYVNRHFFIFNQRAYITIQKIIGSEKYLSSERQLKCLSKIIKIRSSHRFYTYNM